MVLVQVRHAGGSRWITIGAYADRAAAARGGSTALISPEQGGYGAAQVRLVTEAQLAHQGIDVLSAVDGDIGHVADPAA